MEGQTRRDEYLKAIADRVILSLGTVADAARRELEARGEVPRNPGSVLAGGSNVIAHDGSRSAIAKLGTAQRDAMEGLRRLAVHPFVARVVTVGEDGERRVYYVARVGGLKSSGLTSLDGMVAAYHAPLGRVAECAAGDEITVRVPGKGERTYQVLERTRLDPDHSAAGWDGLNDHIEADGFVVTLESLRRFLKGIAAEPLDLVAMIEAEAAQHQAVHQGIRRKTIERMSLRDQAILDRYQGEVFRLPLNRRVMLSGPPGTGKTTTLVKRVAHKINADERTDGDEDAEIVPAERRAEVFRQGNWVMFTPTELLRLYLRESFNQEGVAAPDERIRTWTEERRRLARDVFRILRSENWGRFKLDEKAETLTSDDARALQALAQEFTAAFEAQLVDRYERHLQGLAKSTDPELAKLSQTLRQRAGGTTLKFAQLFDLYDSRAEVVERASAVEKTTSAMLRDLMNRLLARDATLLERIAAALGDTMIEPELGDEDDEDAEDDGAAEPLPRDRKAAALRALRAALLAKAKEVSDGRSRTRSGSRPKVIELLGSALPGKDVLAQLGAQLLILEHLRFLGRTHRNLVDRVPTEYQRFRRAALESNRYRARETRAALQKGLVNGHEVDVMLLVMMRNGTRFFTRDGMRALRYGVDPQFAILNGLRGEYVTQVLVDEATDFSPVQLACMKEVARPEFRSFFACGDVRQRVTSYGIGRLDDLQWVASDIDVRPVNIGYRQSGPLAELAEAMTALWGLEGDEVRRPPHTEDAAIPPVLGEGLSGLQLAQWLCARIREVERALGKLPSIAIFVDGDERLDPLVQELQPLLDEHNVTVVACKEGRVVGTERQVRAFDIQHIKGLEFEAVFFVGVDELAERIPALFDRYLYVGVTRAATYLGVTCVGKLPAKLDPIRRHFATDGWD